MVNTSIIVVTVLLVVFVEMLVLSCVVVSGNISRAEEREEIERLADKEGIKNDTKVV